MNRLVQGAFAALGFFLVGVCATVAYAQEGEENDTITKSKDNTKLNGKVTEENLKTVKITVGKAATELPWKDIKRIDYTGAGAADLRKAEAYLQQGAVPDSAQELEKLRKNTAIRDVLRAHVLNDLGLCYVRMGEYDKAIEVLNELFSKNPKTQFIAVGGGEALVNAYLGKKDAAGAKAALDKLETAVGGGLGVLKGRVYEASGDFAGAAGAYGTVTAEEQKPAAELGIARCLLGQKKVGEAQAKFQGLTSRTELPVTVLAGAWNGLGEITYADGASKNDPEKITDALFMFLRGSVLYVPQTGDSTTEYEHALWGSHRCFKTLSELADAKSEAKKKYMERAKDRLEALSSKFPNSSYLQTR